jgi:hypothetical protein
VCPPLTLIACHTNREPPANATFKALAHIGFCLSLAGGKTRVPSVAVNLIHWFFVAKKLGNVAIF